MISIVSVYQANIDKRFLSKEWYQKILGIMRSTVGSWIEMDTTIIYVDEPEMRRVNHIYHHQDRVTDVLSFFYPQTLIEKNEGELYLCVPQIDRQARRYRTTFTKEYARVIIHGLLHLQGYDHMKSKERKHMNMLAAKIFSQAKGRQLC